MLRTSSIVLAAFLLLAAGPAGALTLDFEDFDHGDIVAAPISTASGITLVVENYNKSFDIAVAFDSSGTGSLEPDMEFDGGWASGNIPDQELGKILMLQANDTCSATSCTDLFSEGKRPAGKFTYLLNGTASTFSFDLIDVEDQNLENGRITFFLLEDGAVDVEVESFSFSDFLSLGQGVQFGNRSANHVDLGEIGTYNAFAIELGGSGGVDNIDIDFVPVPEPTTAGLLSLGLSAVALAVRRRPR